jgi:hypothetical protein
MSNKLVPQKGLLLHQHQMLDFQKARELPFQTQCSYPK